MGADLGTDSVNSEPNVVPLCDILLVLLIIFMVITPAAQQGIDIQLPEKSSGAPGEITPGGGIVLTIEKDNTLKINQEIIGFELLETKLREIYMSKTNKRIFIRADESLPYKDVFRIIDIVKGSGVDVLGVMTGRYQSDGDANTSAEQG